MPIPVNIIGTAFCSTATSTLRSSNIPPRASPGACPASARDAAPTRGSLRRLDAGRVAC
jgi:hypothetical protein